MYQALYRAYRPETFDEVLGQEHIVRILKNQIENDSTSHAYLFCGTRGTGKTTTARLLAKGLNCLSNGEKPCGECANCRAIKDGKFVDVTEIDAASHNGVEDIRALNENVNYPPAVGRKKIYIIDEVHMLSQGAFNALLKTLEEPPSYVTFILATTEIHKVPATIISRCMRLDFKRIPENTLVEGMTEICNKNGINAEENALRIIAANSDGAVRDGLSILDQCISSGSKVVTADDVLKLLGASSDEDFIKITDMVRMKKTSEALEFLAEALSEGKDVRQFNKDWINHFRNLLIVKFARNPGKIINMSDENIERIRSQAKRIETIDINRAILELSKTYSEGRKTTQPRILLELAIVKLCLEASEINSLQDFEDEMKISRDVGQVDRLPKSSAPEKLEQEPETPAVFSDARENSEYKSIDEEVDELEQEEFPGFADENEFDCSEIWDKIFEDGEAAQGSFYLLRTGGTLTSIDENDFTIVVGSDFNEKLIERNRSLIEDLMEKNTGKRRIMRVSKKNLRGSEETSIEEIAEKSSEFLGVDVDIK